MFAAITGHPSRSAVRTTSPPRIWSLIKSVFKPLILQVNEQNPMKSSLNRLPRLSGRVWRAEAPSPHHHVPRACHRRRQLQKKLVALGQSCRQKRAIGGEDGQTKAYLLTAEILRLAGALRNWPDFALELSAAGTRTLPCPTTPGISRGNLRS